jgi:ketopantoate reductase
MELEALTGAVVKLGRESNVPTPVNQLLYTVLKPHAQGGGKQEVNPKP